MTGLRMAIIALVIGLIGSLGGILIDVHAWLAAYLAAFIAGSAVPIGSLAVLLVTYLVRDRWTVELHGPLTAAVRTMPVAGLLALPIVIASPWLYPWDAI